MVHAYVSWGRRGVRANRVIAALCVALLVGLGPAALRSSTSLARGLEKPARYSNPVIAQNVADPSVIKALDGYYYIVGTSDFWNGGSYHILPIFRSTDLVHWKYVADAFTARPSWVTSAAGLWAPDLQYYNHRYYMYYAASDTAPLPSYGTTGGSAIGVATATKPTGPWIDRGPSAGPNLPTGPLVPPRPCALNSDRSCYYWTLDPAELTDTTGQRYLYYGSYYGGTAVQRLTSDGLHLAGTPTEIGHGDRYEGTYVIRHDVNGRPYYYDFSSTASCCDGPNTAYSVVTNRSTSPTGTFVDQNGVPMLHPGSLPAPTTRPVDDPTMDNTGAQGGGYPTLRQNGNRWHGPGHNALIADLSGHLWIVYHGVDRSRGWISGGPSNITFRQVLLDRIDWTADGWPVVNRGAGPSLTNAAPATTPTFGDNFNGTKAGCSARDTALAFPAAWRVLSGAWSRKAGSCVTGGFVRQSSSAGQSLLVSRAAVPAGSRIECDLRLVRGGRYGCLAAMAQSGRPGQARRYIAALLDPARHLLVTDFYSAGRLVGGERTTRLPAHFLYTDWHHLAIDEGPSTAGRSTITVTVSDRDRDPLALQRRPIPTGFGAPAGAVGFITQSAGADFDNVTAAPLGAQSAPAQGVPSPGSPLAQYSDEFNGPLGSQWSWLREDAGKHRLAGGQLSIMVDGDLYRDANTAHNILLETAPSGNYMVETKVSFDPRSNYQQAGLLIYSDDDHYIKVGPLHHQSLNKMLSGKESLEPTSGGAACDVQPAAGSNVAVHTYTSAQCPNEGESWDYLTNPQPRINGSTATTPQVTNWLRIYRKGNVYTPYTSIDGTSWVRGAAWDLQPVSAAFPLKIGLFAFAAGGDASIPALFDYVHVYSEP